MRLRTDEWIFQKEMRHIFIACTCRCLVLVCVLMDPGKSKYLLEQCIGHGTQSVVYRAREVGTKKIFAMKQIMCPDVPCPLTSLGANFREVSTLNQLRERHCENIVQLVDVVIGTDRLSLVFECCDESLSDLIRRFKRKRGGDGRLPMGLVRDLSNQILVGMSQVHACRIIHRDIKPQNLFVKREREGSTGLVLKIGDFGLAKQYTYPPAPETLDVASLWYRSPEVLLRSGYDVGMDLWGIGCVIAEMMLGEPLFIEDSEIGMLMKIFQTLGTPGIEEWPAVGYAVNASSEWPKWDRLKCLARFRRRICSVTSTSGFELICGLLKYDSNERMRCKDALRHDFFENSENRV